MSRWPGLPAAADHPRIEGLTGLRFFAALGVVLAHFEPIVGLPALHPLFVLGGSTVPLFFTLSGFVLTITYDEALRKRGEGALRRYARARVARIVPLYWGALLLTLFAYLATGYTVSLGGDASTPGKATSFALSMLALQAWVPDTTVQQFWNAPGWSISAEAFFYAALPALLRWPPLSGSWRSIGLVLAMGWTAHLAYLGAVSPLMAADPSWLGFGARLPLLGLPSFMLGIVLARRHLATTDRSGPSAQVRWPLALLLASAFALFDTGSSFLRAWTVTQLLWVPLFGWLVYALAADTSPVARILRSPGLVLLGDASYALYLIHWLPLGFLLRGTFGQPAAASTGLWAILGLVVASVLLHLFFEAPARRLILRRAPPRHPSRLG